MNYFEFFAERLNDLIFDKHVSFETLSKTLKIDFSLIYKYLRKEYFPSLPNAIKLCDYFNCSLDYLFGLTDENILLNIVILKPFSIRFQEILKENSCTRYQLKKETPLTKQSIDDWFHGKRMPTIENLIILAKYFDCSLDYLVGRET